MLEINQNHESFYNCHDSIFFVILFSKKMTKNLVIVHLFIIIIII